MQPQLPDDILTQIKNLQSDMAIVQAAVVNDIVEIGTVLVWPQGGVPSYKYLAADGSAIDRTAYAVLFGEYNTKYGIGDGSTSFNLPNFNSFSLEQEISYTEFTGNVTVTSATESGATTVVTAPALTANGTDSFWVEFYTPLAEPGVNGDSVIEIYLFDGTTSLGIVGQVLNSGAGSFPLSVPVVTKKKITPSAGSHTYSVRASQAIANGTIFGGTGGAGNFMPGYIRLTADVGNALNTFNFIVKVL